LICFSKLTIPETFYPGTYSWYYDYLGYPGNSNYYQGKVIILCNQGTQSQAEYSSMIMKAMPNSVVIGSQTAGADGNVSYFHLSEDIQTGFTALGVYYPNGDSTQRIGIVPDSVVYPTSSGIRQGRDEVLEKALLVAGCLVSFLSVSPQNQNVEATAGTVTFTITSNTNWSAVSDSAWCSATASGSGNGMINASYSENTTHQPRTANIRISVAGMADQTVSVTQAKSTNGVEENHEELFRIYPNPTQGLFRVVSATGEKETLDICIRDLMGNVLLEKHYTNEKEYDIDFSLAPQGCYFITIRAENYSTVHNLIIN